MPVLTFFDIDFTPLKQVLVFHLDSNIAIALCPEGCVIFDNRLLWQTVSNASDKTTATQTVRSRASSS